MKKLIAALLLFINILLFFNIRAVYMEKDISDVLQMHWFHPDVAHTTLMIGNWNDETISGEVSEAMFNMFRDLTESYDMLITTPEIFDHERNEYISYWATGIPLNERLNLITDVSLNFNEQDIYFYTNQHDVENGVNFYLLNNRMKVRLLPMTMMGRIRGSEYSFVARSQVELDEAVSAFMVEFESYVDRIIEFSGEPMDVDAEINAFLSPIILITMILVFLIIILYIHLYSKKIAIFKMMGISFFNLIKQLFVPMLIMIALTIATTQAILFLLFIGTINIRTVPIIGTLVHASGLQLLGVSIAMIISCLLLLFIPTYAMLKNSNMTRFLMGVNYVIKMVILVMILLFSSDRIDLVQENWEMLNHVRYYEQNAPLVEAQRLLFLPQYRGDGIAHGSLHMNLLRESDFDYSNPDIIHEHELLYEYHRAYKILNEVGAVFSQGSVMFSGEPTITVNENYLTRYPIKDIEGNAVDISQSNADMIHLIPEIHLEQRFVSELINQGDDVIAINNEQTVFDYSFGWDFFGIPRQPYVITVLNDTFFRLEASPFDVFVEGSINVNELLSGTVFYNRIETFTVGDELNRIQERNLQEIMDHIMVMTPTFALVLVIIVQYSYLYLKVYQKRIYAKKLMGHNSFRIFSGLLLESSLAVIASISIALYLRLDFRLLTAIIILDIVVYLAIVAISQWKHSLVYDYNE